jgi:hypothetical protein
MRLEGGSRTLGFVAMAVAAAVSLGLLVITATVLGVDALRSGRDSSQLDLRFYLLSGGTLAGIMLASLMAWRLLAPVASVYRRGGLSVVSAFVTILLMLVCIPVNQLLGRVGLLVLLGLTALFALLCSREARRRGADA